MTGRTPAGTPALSSYSSKAVTTRDGNPTNEPVPEDTEAGNVTTAKSTGRPFRLSL